MVIPFSRATPASPYGWYFAKACIKTRVAFPIIRDLYSNHFARLDMRLLTIIMAHSLLAGLAIAQDTGGFKNEKEKLSYAVGMGMGKNLERQGIEVNPELLLKGLKDVLGKGKPRLSEAEFKKTMQSLNARLRAKQKNRQSQLGQTNKKEGAAFLARNKRKKGVVTLPSGLQYRVLRKGKGKKPGPGNQVVTHYRGTLLDGKEFDSSYKRGQPATFPVKGVIAGWTEALQLMAVGAKWKLFIPSDLAYGARGSGRLIGPHAALIFEIELLQVKEKSAPRKRPFRRK